MAKMSVILLTLSQALSPIHAGAVTQRTWPILVSASSISDPWDTPLCPPSPQPSFTRRISPLGGKKDPELGSKVSVLSQKIWRKAYDEDLENYAHLFKVFHVFSIV